MATTIPFEMTAEFMIPFLFVFAVVFGVLSFTNVLKNNAVNAVVSFTLAAFAATNTGVLAIITKFLPTAIGFFIVMFFLAFLFRLFGLKPDQRNTMEGMVVGGGVLILLLTLGYYVFQTYSVEFPVIGGGENLVFFFGMLLIISIFWGAMKIGESLPAHLRGAG